MIILYFNESYVESYVGINRGIVHENYIPDAYKYQTQNRWQPLVASMNHMRRVDLWIELCESSPTRNCFLFASTWILVRSMLLIFLLFCVVLCCAFVFVCLHPVSCIPNSASKLYIPDCPFCIL